MSVDAALCMRIWPASVNDDSCAGGRDVDVWLVDVEWHHLETGDIYAAGPDASGGRYWVVRNPPPGFPYVPRYKTDTYTIEFIADLCPD